MNTPLSEVGVPLQTHDERGPRFKRPVAVFYFGCADDRTGHYWHKPRMGYVPDALSPFHASEIDGRYTPKDTTRAGVCTLTYLDGWSILAWWDYSVDKRPGSNSVLVARGTHSFDELMLLLNAEFPNVASRQLEPMILTGTE